MTDPSTLDALKRHPGAIRIFAQKVKLRKQGREYVGLCPWHQENHGSFKVYQKQGVWLATCHGACQKTCNVFQFLESTEGISFSEAVERVSEFLGAKSDNARVDQVFKPVVQDDTPKKKYSLQEYSKLEQAFSNSEQAQDYLLKRGISVETAKKCHTGFRQDLGKIAGGDASHLSALGWLAFPRIKNDEVVGIHYRSIREKVQRRQPGMVTELYGLEDIDVLEPIYILEGEVDRLTFAEAGLRSVALPSAGAHLTPEQKDLLAQAEYSVLAGDTDPAGEACMQKLWAELDRAYLLKWPEGCKDANDVLLKDCKGDVSSFRTKVEQLTALAKSSPMPGVYDIRSAMTQAGKTSLADHPLRLRMPWKEVDRMAILLPGSVTTISATNTGCGKSAFVLQLSLDAARFHNEVVVTYQCELNVAEVSTMCVAHLLRKDRNHLTPEDGKLAVQKLGDVRYYVGHDPTLTTVEPVLDLIEAAIKRTGATIAVLDHIHAVIGNVDNEVQALANAMARIKRMAQKYLVKFIVVAQPRKAGQTSKGKSIHVTDLKGSEALASAADAVFTLHRDYVKQSDPNAPAKDEYDPNTDIHLLKVRSKGDGAAQARLFFMGIHATFLDLAENTLTNTDNSATMFSS